MYVNVDMNCRKELVDCIYSVIRQLPMLPDVNHLTGMKVGTCFIVVVLLKLHVQKPYLQR